MSVPTPQQSYAGVLAALLRDELWDADVFAGCDLDALHQAAVDHDIIPLLADVAARRPDMPAALRSRLRDEAQDAVVLDLLREVELKRTIDAFSRAGVVALVFKGSHLAYTHYARPDLRSRIDSDLLIPVQMRERAHDVLTRELSYEASTKVSGDLSATQQTYTIRPPGAPPQSLDVHWRLASPQVFAHVLSYDELIAASIPIAPLGRMARGPSPVHALLIACMHRVAHHDDAEALKWFVDIHFLASRLTAAEWQAFVVLALERHVGVVCRHSLRRTVELMHTAVPLAVLMDPRLSGDAREEPTAAYLTPRTQAEVVAADLRALGSWRDRVRLLREHLFPSSRYMRTMYARESSAPLSVLYAVRIARGAGRWLFSKSAPRG